MNRRRASAGSSAEIVVGRPPRPPVLATTAYDRVSALMIAVVVALCLLVGWVAALWWWSLPVVSPESDPEISTVTLPGGDDQSDQPLKVESPADPEPDPSVVDVDESEPSAETVIDQLIENSDRAARQIAAREQTDDRNGSLRGSSIGDVVPPLGPGDRVGPRPPHERWFIRFADGGSLETYAAQLDHFGVQIGIAHGGKIELLSELAGPQANRVTVRSGKGMENQMFFAWAGGRRKQADVDLFREKAGLDATEGTIIHLYPDAAVRELLRVERAAAKRPVGEISRTYFTVVRDGGGFRFKVVLMRYRD